MAKRRKTISSFFNRSQGALYKGARVLGDVKAITSPSRLPKRLVNRWIGRHIVRRLWWR